MVTVVADRESDIYEMWARIPDAKTHLLVRACRDRAIETEHGSLYEWLSTQPVAFPHKTEQPALNTGLGDLKCQSSSIPIQSGLGQFGDLDC